MPILLIKVKVPNFTKNFSIKQQLCNFFTFYHLSGQAKSSDLYFITLPNILIRLFGK